MPEQFIQMPYSSEIPLQKLLDIIKKYETYMLGGWNSYTKSLFEFFWGHNADLTKYITVFKLVEDDVIGFLGFAFPKKKKRRLVALFYPDYFTTSLPKQIIDAAFALAKERHISQIEYSTFGEQQKLLDSILQQKGCFPSRRFIRMRLKITNYQEREPQLILDDLSLEHLSEIQDLTEYVSLVNLAFAPVTGFSPLDVEQTKTRLFLTSKRTLDFFLAYIRKKLIGVCLIKPSTNKEMCTLQTLAVHPEYQHNGIGQWLAETGIRHCKKQNFKEISLVVVFDNEKALKLYQKLGFRVDDTDQGNTYLFTL